MAKPEGSGNRRRPEPEFLEIGRVLRPWGVQGEVKIEVLASRPEEVKRARRVYLGEEARPFDVQRARSQRGAMLLKLAGCDTPEQADALRGLPVSIAFRDATPLRPHQFYQHQIIGLQVVTPEGDDLGQIVEILETGANDVYVVRGRRGEVLLPARVEVVKRVDLEAGQMIVSLLPGLLPD
ncbi:MAG: ribosome maturation factor RimM [Burkholderiales bacterium]